MHYFEPTEVFKSMLMQKDRDSNLSCMLCRDIFQSIAVRVLCNSLASVRSGPAKPNKGQLMNFSQGHSGTEVQCESYFFPKGKHQNSQKWAKFMNFSFLPFLWFGLPGRLLIQGSLLISRLFKPREVASDKHSERKWVLLA